jgi:hypothetical protein
MRLHVAVLVVLLSGCASARPTPAQERVYGQAAECTRVTGYSMNVTYVSPDGRQIRLGEGVNAGAYAQWKQCMRDRYRWAGD